MTALHIAAYRSDLASVRALIEILQANVNQRMYDDSTALMVAIANKASHEVIRYLIVDAKSDLNRQSLDVEDSWSQVTNFAGFSALMMAVNMQDYETVRMLLQAGARTELYTSNLGRSFPIPSNGILNVHESKPGCRFTALHIATSMNELEMIHLLVKEGHANINARLLNGMHCSSLEHDFLQGRCQHPPIRYEKDRQYSCFPLDTPLHLCESNSLTAQVLLTSGSCLLAQNIRLTAAWEKHQDILQVWLQSPAVDIQNTVMAVCKAKRLPVDIALYLAEYYVSLHIADHFQFACEQELSYTLDRDNWPEMYCIPHWPWMALALTYHLEPTKGAEEAEVSSNLTTTAWMTHGLGILRSIYGEGNNGRNRQLSDPILLEFVRMELQKVKRESAKELFHVVRSKLRMLCSF